MTTALHLFELRPSTSFILFRRNGLLRPLLLQQRRVVFLLHCPKRSDRNSSYSPSGDKRKRFFSSFLCCFCWFVDLRFVYSASLASLTRETGPKVVRGDPARKAEGQKVSHVSHEHHYTPTIGVSDSSLKFTHILYNLSPAGTSYIRSFFVCIHRNVMI